MYPAGDGDAAAMEIQPQSSEVATNKERVPRELQPPYLRDH
jgi:hypothetical protein